MWVLIYIGAPTPKTAQLVFRTRSGLTAELAARYIDHRPLLSTKFSVADLDRAEANEKSLPGLRPRRAGHVRLGSHFLSNVGRDVSRAQSGAQWTSTSTMPHHSLPNAKSGSRSNLRSR